MIKLIILAITLCTHSSVLADFNGAIVCPAVDPPTPVYFPHETDCSKFYECHNGTPHLIDCPEGLDFNPTLNVCDYPEQAGCRGKKTSESSSSSTHNPTSLSPVTSSSVRPTFNSDSTPRPTSSSSPRPTSRRPTPSSSLRPTSSGRPTSRPTSSVKPSSSSSPRPTSSARPKPTSSSRHPTHSTSHKPKPTSSSRHPTHSTSHKPKPTSSSRHPTHPTSSLRPTSSTHKTTTDNDSSNESNQHHHHHHHHSDSSDSSDKSDHHQHHHHSNSGDSSDESHHHHQDHHHSNSGDESDHHHHQHHRHFNFDAFKFDSKSGSKDSNDSSDFDDSKHSDDSDDDFLLTKTENKKIDKNILYKILFGDIDGLEGEDCTPDAISSTKSHPYDCTKYLDCYKGTYLVKSCPKQYLFHSSIRICVPPGYSKCNVQA